MFVLKPQTNTCVDILNDISTVANTMFYPEYGYSINEHIYINYCSLNCPNISNGGI